ncbi:unnamed protein product [Mytilus edulis]|uniref:Integrase core domain-containing protein n=1 Tax=Mytilus edulis TaxID=6550 RepID=A0A8S3UJ61_MYTED|nr:unnamed protein product [Mytilus edulis]
MAESEMLKVLRKVGLLHVREMFDKEKITPNFVSMLSKHELEYLGVTILAHMMTLRMECIKYGNMKPVKTDSLDGNPKYHVDKNGISDQLNGLHLIALHYIYMDKINRRLDIWTQAWASHRMRTTKSSPVNIWIAGQIQNPVGTQLSERDLVDYGLEGNIDAANLMDDGRQIIKPHEHWINE